jgi:DNA-directed RNA polymerase specialized sigma24 family protein
MDGIENSSRSENETNRMVHNGIGKILQWTSPKKAIAFVFKEYYGLSYRDIGKALKVSYQTAQYYYKQAVKEITERRERNGHEQ